jgi:predicted TIM-barrel fold metal-dependent hydrolase
MDWTQAAIESLPADQQDKYAYKNAKRLFGL